MQNLPPAPTEATLDARLKDLATEQQDEEALTKTLKRQGDEKPTNQQAIGNWLARAGTVVPFVGMVHDEPYIKVLFDVLHYAALGRDDKDWDDKWFVAIDDREEDGTTPPT